MASILKDLGIDKVRKFNGELYHPECATTSKKEAGKIAKRFQELGYKVKIIKGKGILGYKDTWRIFTSLVRERK